MAVPDARQGLLLGYLAHPAPAGAQQPAAAAAAAGAPASVAQPANTPAGAGGMGETEGGMPQQAQQQPEGPHVPPPHQQQHQAGFDGMQAPGAAVDAAAAPPLAHLATDPAAAAFWLPAHLQAAIAGVDASLARLDALSEGSWSHKLSRAASAPQQLQRLDSTGRRPASGQQHSGP